MINVDYNIKCKNIQRVLFSMNLLDDNISYPVLIHGAIGKAEQCFSAFIFFYFIFFLLELKTKQKTVFLALIKIVIYDNAIDLSCIV